MINDMFEMLEDLRELQHLYIYNELTYLDFQEKVQKYQKIVDKFEYELAEAFEHE